MKPADYFNERKLIPKMLTNIFKRAFEYTGNKNEMLDYLTNMITDIYLKKGDTNES